MLIFKRGLFFSLLVGFFYILAPIQLISADDSQPESRYSWFNEVLCKEHNWGNVPNVIIRSFEQAKALCPEKTDYSAVKDMYRNILSLDICSEINLPELASGSQCISHKGGLFEIYENPETHERAIVDLSENGKIWFDYLYVNTHHKNAVETCEKNGKRLPTKEEFLIAEENGLREAFYNSFNTEELWALDGVSKRHAYVFDAETGKIKNSSYGFTGQSFLPDNGIFLSALCISDKN